MLVIFVTAFIVVVANVVIFARVHLSHGNIVKAIKTAVGDATGCEIELDEVDVSISGVVRLYDIRLKTPDGGAEVLSVGQVLVDVSLLRLLGKGSGIDEIEIARPQMTLNAETVELLEALTSGSGGSGGGREIGGQIPRKITIASGKLHIAEGMIYEASPAVSISDLNVSLQPVSFSARQLTMEGSARVDRIGAVAVSGKADLSAKTLSMEIGVPDVRVTEEFASLLPSVAMRAWNEIGLVGRVGMSLYINYGWGEKPSFEQSITAAVSDSTARLKDFPLPLTGVTARLRSDGDSLVIEHGLGRYKDGTIEVARGLIDRDVSNFEVLIRDLPLDDGVRDALPPSMLRTWQEFGISGGRVSGTQQFTLHKASEHRYPQHSLDLRISGLSARYAHLPIPVDNISGSITWHSPNRPDNAFSQLKLNLQGVAGKGTFNVYGRIPMAPVRRLPTDDAVYRIPGEGTDLVISGRRIEIDDTLRKAVPDEMAEILDTFAPSGNFDVNVLLKMENRNDGNKIISRNVIVDLNGIQATLERFPYPITNLVGKLDWDGKRVKFTELRGLCGNARVTITGQIGTGGAPGEHTLVVMVDQLEVDERLRNALDADLRSVWDQLSPAGRVNVFMTLNADADGKISISRTVLTLDQCRVMHVAFPYAVENLTGQVAVADGVVSFTNIAGTARDRDTPVTLSGRINIRDDRDEPGELVLKANRLVLDRVLRDALGERGDKFWQSFSPAGQVNAAVVLEIGKGNSAELRSLRLELHDVAATPERFPYPLENLTGTVTITDDATVIENLSGRAGTGRITAKGELITLQPPAEGTQAAQPQTTGKISLGVRDIAFDQQLKQALPPDWLASWQSLQPDGRFSAQLEVALPPGGAMTIGKGSRATVRGLSIRSIPLPDAAFSLEMTRNTIDISDFQGTYHGGQVRGAVRIQRQADSAAEAPSTKPEADGGASWQTHVELYNIDLKQINDGGHYLRGTIRGQLTATVDLAGKGNDSFAMRGSGKATVTNGHLMNVPVIADVIMKLLNPSLNTGDPVLTDADTEAKVEQGRVIFEHVKLSGTSAPIGAIGHIKLDGTMSMDFYASKDEKSFLRIVPILGPIIDDHFFSTLRKNLVQLKVTGRIDDPYVQAVPVPIITKPLGVFFRFVFGSGD